MSFTKTVIIISHVPVFVTAGYTAYIYKTLSRELKAFSHFVLLSGLLQLIALVLWFQAINNMPVLHLLVALGFYCLARFYQVISEGFISKKIIWVVMVLFLAFTAINSIFIQDVTTFNSYALTTESFLIVIFSLTTYMLLINEVVKEQRKDVTSLNWINSGLFIYYFSNLVIFYFGRLITTVFTYDFNRYTWVIHSFFSIIMYICFLVGLWKRSKN